MLELSEAAAKAVRMSDSIEGCSDRLLLTGPVMFTQDSQDEANDSYDPVCTCVEIMSKAYENLRGQRTYHT